MNTDEALEAVRRLGIDARVHTKQVSESQYNQCVADYETARIFITEAAAFRKAVEEMYGKWNHNWFPTHDEQMASDSIKWFKELWNLLGGGTK